jgi:hypothetical protein
VQRYFTENRSNFIRRHCFKQKPGELFTRDVQYIPLRDDNPHNDPAQLNNELTQVIIFFVQVRDLGICHVLLWFDRINQEPRDRVPARYCDL